MGRILLLVFNLNLHRASLHPFYLFIFSSALSHNLNSSFGSFYSWCSSRIYSSTVLLITPVWSVYLQWHKPKVCKKDNLLPWDFSATSYNCKINEMQSHSLKIKGNYKEGGRHRPYRTHSDLKTDDGLCADHTMYHETSPTPNSMLQWTWGKNSAACQEIQTCKIPATHIYHHKSYKMKL